jgi:hypothetical protein
MRLSVIVPTCNRAELALRAMDSALAAGAAEVVVIDDASVDRTWERLAGRYGADARVRAIRLDENAGPSSARNRGLAVAGGDLVLFLDSDDTLAPDALALATAAFDAVPALQFLTLEGESCAVDGSRVERGIVRGACPGWNGPGFDAERFVEVPLASPRGPLVLSVGDCLPAIAYGDLFYLSGLVVRREAALAAGPFDPRLRYLEDWDFTARLCLQGIGGHLDACGFRRETARADQLSRVDNQERRAVMHQRVLRSLRAACGSRRKRLAMLRGAQAEADYWLARCLDRRAHPRLARGYFLRSLRARHKMHKCLVWLLLGLPGVRRLAGTREAEERVRSGVELRAR